MAQPDDYYQRPIKLQPPELRSTGGVFEFHFPEIEHHCRVDRLSTSAKHETTAEITIWSDNPVNKGHIHQTRLNLTSGNTRKTMARYLGEQANFIQWGDFLEFVCVMTLDKHRAGNEPIKLLDHPMPDGVQWRLQPYLQERQATVMFGDGGSGKSWLALTMGLLVATGEVGWRMMPIPGAVLYLDYETDADTVLQRMNMLTASLSLPIPEEFYYREMVQTVANDIIEIAKMVLAYDIKLIIIDSAAPATGEPESQAAATEYFRALRDLGSTTLTVAHVSKSGRSNQPFGSIFWRNAPRSNIRVYGQSEEGGFLTALRHTKVNNGQLLRDRAFRFEFHDNEAHVFEADPADLDEMNGGDEDGVQYARADIRQTIVESLRDGSRTIRELVQMTGRNRDTIEKTLQRNQDLFLRVNASPGRATNWGLRHYEEEN